MRGNATTVLRGERVALVPYLAEHVVRYHAWMQDPVLRQQTASEPLTLDEEYAMQKSWLEDNDKLTFIIVDAQDEGDVSAAYRESKMIGDVNCFLQVDEDGLRCGEVELMIAEADYRGRGYGNEVLKLFMPYASKVFDLSYLAVKISAQNARSIRLFRSVGFQDYKKVEIFDELEMRLNSGQASAATRTQ